MAHAGTTPHLGVRMHSLPYDGRPDWLFRVWVGMWNISSRSGKGEVCKKMRKKIIDVC